MRVFAPGFGLSTLFLGSLMIWAEVGVGQNPPASHVVIPNPTPRQPDLEKVYADDASGQKKKGVLSVQSQLRAREIWLESNQILLLAQQLQQEMHDGGKSGAMTASAAKVGKIQKLAQSVQEKMTTQ